MKRKLLFLIILMSIKVSAQELLLHFPFDGDASDASGNDYNV